MKAKFRRRAYLQIGLLGCFLLAITQLPQSGLAQLRLSAKAGKGTQHKSYAYLGKQAVTQDLKSNSIGAIVFSYNGKLCSVEPDGSNFSYLTFGDKASIDIQPSWSPDKTKIAFASNRATTLGNPLRHVFNIWILDTTDNSLTALTASTEENHFEPEWSPDGSKIVFVRGFDATVNGQINLSSCYDAEVVAIDLATGVESMIVPALGGGGTDPAWSPDGSMLAYAASDGNDYEIYTVAVSCAADGSVTPGAITQRTSNGVHDADPTWSPDSTQLAVGGNYDATYASCLFSLHGWMSTTISRPYIQVDILTLGNLMPTDTLPAVYAPVWSPDGTRLLVDVGGEIGIHELQTPNSTRVLSQGTTFDW